MTEIEDAKFAMEAQEKVCVHRGEQLRIARERMEEAAAERDRLRKAYLELLRKSVEVKP